MDFTVSTIESAAHTAVEAIEHPFHTIGARLKSAGEHLASFFGHPYCAPPLREALDALHGVVVDLAQEVAELRVPCPCKPAPTSATVDQASASTSVGPSDAGLTFKDRAKSEADELLSKRTSLGAFIASAAFDAVPQAEQQRLVAQAQAMTDYQVALSARIAADFGA